MGQDIEALQAALREFAREREWGQFHSPKNLADVLIYVLQLADKVGIYPVDAAWWKMEANGRKYPVERAKGRITKYTEL